GLLCLRSPIRTLLWWFTVLGVISGPLFLLIHNASQAYAIGALVGVIAGLFNTVALDLLMRSCPDGLEGIALMFGGGAIAAAYSGTDIFGSWLYEKGGFGLALAVTTVCTA